MKYWNVASVNRLEKLYRDVEDVFKSSKFEQTREINSDVEKILKCSKCERTREMKQ